MSEVAPRLVRIDADPDAGLWIRAEYAERGYADASRTLWAAATTVAALAHAGRWLGAAHGLGLLVLDAWRPLVLQRTLYEEYREAIVRGTALTGAALAEHVARFVTDPERATAPPAHSTGGAIDLTLCDLEHGTELDLGGTFDELSDRSRADYYDGQPEETARAFADRRAVLLAAMDQAGFARLPSEWWHFELGTRLWADAAPDRTATLTQPIDVPEGWMPIGHGRRA